MTIAKGTVVAAIALLVVLIGGISVLGAIAARNYEPQRVHRPGQMTQMERSGEMREMLQEHQSMMDRMRADASPQMLEMMNEDSMWKMMRSGHMIEMMENHQAEIDHMLGRMPGR